MATGAAVLDLWLFVYGGHGIGVSGTITASHASGAVDGGDGNDDWVGGLVGVNGGTITASYATGAVDGGDGTGDRAGGLVGWNNIGTITASYASGDADGGDGSPDWVGGLVGIMVARSRPAMALARRREERYRLARWTAPATLRLRVRCATQRNLPKPIHLRRQVKDGRRGYGILPLE